MKTLLARRFLVVPLSLALVLSQTACLTPKLWSNTRERSFREPAPNPRLALHQSPVGGDVLVSYDELAESKTALRRRAFFLQPNLACLAAGKKPAFVKPEQATAMCPVPLDPVGGAVAPAPVHAITEKHGHRFTLHAGAQTIGPVDLPVYQNCATEVGRVMLTPFAVAGDAAIIGAFGILIGAYWWAHDYGSLSVR